MTWRSRHLYLVGLPGAGKSAIGAELAKLLAKFDYEFVDLDKAVERIAGKSIADVFQTLGEPAFRSFETQALLDASRRSHCVVATGGGIVRNPLNRSIMRGSGVTVWVDVSVRQAATNVQRDMEAGKERPLFAGQDTAHIQDTVRTLLEARRPFYEQAQLHFVTRSPRGDEYTAAELADQLLIALENMSTRVALPPQFETVVARSAFGEYPIFVGSGCARRELLHAIRAMDCSEVVCISDTNVAALYREEFEHLLRGSLSGPNSHFVTIPAGEAHKNQDTLFDLLNRFHELRLTKRNAVIIALGGGVVTDIAGLAANLYHRGLPVISIPTTLLAQADAAIGGKTGIDFKGVKNSIGTFYPPKQILIDPIFLQTLPERELHSGLAEIFKYALIGSRSLWDELASLVRRLVRGVDQSYEHVIYQSVLEKLRYVEADEFERSTGIRELLNFGHTFGHALESATGFTTLLHGEAVLLGMRGATWLSKELGYITEQVWRDVEVVLGRIPVRAELRVLAQDVFTAFKHDKKHTQQFRVILLAAVGSAFTTEITEQDALRTIEYILTLV